MQSFVAVDLSNNASERATQAACQVTISLVHADGRQNGLSAVKLSARVANQVDSARWQVTSIGSIAQIEKSHGRFTHESWPLGRDLPSTTVRAPYFARVQ